MPRRDRTRCRYATSPPNAFEWSPDGGSILVSWERAVAIDVTTGAATSISSSPIVAEWAPDGRGVYFFQVLSIASGNRRLGGFFLKELGGSLTTVANEENVRADGLSLNTALVYGVMRLSPARDRVAIVETGPTAAASVRIYDFRSGNPTLANPIRTMSIKGSPATASIAWSPDGRNVAAITFGHDGANVEVGDVATGIWHVAAHLGLNTNPQAGEVDAFGVTNNLSWG